jgi:Na+-driven multidrug efflux pump
MSKSFLLKWVEPKQPLPKERQRFGNRELAALILPILVEQLLTMLVGIADTLMVSYAGEAAVSGVSLVNQLNNVFIFVFGAVASGGAVVASQYIGRVEPDVMEASLTYLVISALSFPALAVYNSAAALFRSMGKTKAIMNISIAMNAVNVIGNAIGIFALHAGVAGVAVPSLVSRTFAAVVMLVLCFQKKNTLYVEPGKVFAWNGKMLKRILNIAVPNGVENGLFQLSKVALSSIVALFGTVQIAANGVAQSF